MERWHASTHTCTDLLCETNHSYAALDPGEYFVCIRLLNVKRRTWSECQGFLREIRLFLVGQQQQQNAKNQNNMWTTSEKVTQLQQQMSCLFELQFSDWQAKKTTTKKINNKKKLSCRLQLYNTSKCHATTKKEEKQRNTRTRNNNNSMKNFIWFKRWQESPLCDLQPPTGNILPTTSQPTIPSPRPSPQCLANLCCLSLCPA